MRMLSRPVDQIQAHYSAVVIGSGYGGAIAAARIARAGRDVCVLERGKELHPGEYPNSALSAAREIQVHTAKADHGSPVGLFDFQVGPDVTVLTGCGLGGTSLINASVALEPSDPIFADDRWPAPLRQHPEVLRPFMQRGQGDARVQPVPAGRGRSCPSCRPSSGRRPASGRPVVRPDLNVTFKRPERGRGAAERVQPVRRLLLRLQLRRQEHGPDELPPRRVRARGAHLHRGRRCSRCGAARAPGGWASTSSGEGPATSRFVTADVVVLAAGTLGSTQILLRSRDLGTAGVGAARGTGSPVTATCSRSPTTPTSRCATSASAAASPGRTRRSGRRSPA